MNFTKHKLLTRCFFILVAVKLIISPWATGDFINHHFKIFNMVVDTLLLFCAVLGISFTEKRFSFLYFSVIGGISISIATILNTQESLITVIKYHLKLYLPLLCFPFTYYSYQKEQLWFIRNTKRILYLAVALFLIGFAFLPDSINRLETWWPAYFSSLHTTSYVAMMCILLCVALTKVQQINKLTACIIIVFCFYAIYMMWGVRTATLACLVYSLCLILIKFRLGNLNCLSLFIIISSKIFVIFVPLIFTSTQFNHFTSGRIAMYLEKYDQLAKNSFTNWLIGNGAKSDLIVSDVWWWAPKGAHSDLITMLVEGGLVYLTIFLFIFFKLTAMGSRLFQFSMLATFITALFSNGIFIRPTAGYLLVLIMVLCFNASGTKKINENSNNL